MSVLNNFTVFITRSLRSCLKKGLRHEFPATIARRTNVSGRNVEDHQLNMKKCLIVSKVTRYEYERHSHGDISDNELEKVLRKRGSDYETLIHNHKEQKLFEQNVATNLEKLGIEVKMASRLTYNEDLIKWCDVVLPCGGDGTFLLAASRVRDANKPVIGFNSAPHKSVGRLCLPNWCSHDIRGALKGLKEGRFRWMRRTRIRTTIACDPEIVEKITPVDLHTLHYSRYPAVNPSPDLIDAAAETPCKPCEVPLTKKMLPFLALNEVFIGESVTSRVSLLRLQIDKGASNHTKSSGLCVTTGTGSTSWHFSINCLRTHSVLELMRTLNEEFGSNLNVSLETARQISEKYNQKLIFPPDAEKLAYSVREYITFEDWPTPRGLKVRDFASSVRVKSHCIDAGLVIDGSVSFPFNDGTEALLEVHPEDALMTVQMEDRLPHH